MLYRHFYPGTMPHAQATAQGFVDPRRAPIVDPVEPNMRLPAAPKHKPPPPPNTLAYCPPVDATPSGIRDRALCVNFNDGRYMDTGSFCLNKSNIFPWAVPDPPTRNKYQPRAVEGDNYAVF